MKRANQGRRPIRSGWIVGVALTGLGCHLLPSQRVNRGLDPRSLGPAATSASVSDKPRAAVPATTPIATPPKLLAVSDEEALGAKAATPMLDQALQRAHIQQETLLAGPTGEARASHAPEPAPRRFEPTPANDTAPIRATLVDPEVMPAAVSVESPQPTPTPESVPAPETAPAEPWATGLEKLRATVQSHIDGGGEDAALWELRGRLLAWMAQAPDATGPKVDDGPLWTTVLSLLAAASDDRAEDPVAAARAIEAHAPLSVTELVVCRKVHGFGQFDPIEGTTCQAGQRVLVYCEVSGLKYEPMPGGDLRLRSRLASRLELLAEGDAKPRWSIDLGTAEDLCRRVRRDYYVNYRLDLPDANTLPPGPYQLRIVQTDRTTGVETDRAIPITISAPAPTTPASTQR
jgi:hypothetical protein